MSADPAQTTDERHVGFTGTQVGMTEAQVARVSRMLHSWKGWADHRDCIGADKQFHGIARSSGLKVAIHPPSVSSKRAYCTGDIVHPMADYLTRNRQIVDASAGLIATPKSFEEELRSGTWSTIRYARKSKKPVVIVWPDGSVSNEKR